MGSSPYRHKHPKAQQIKGYACSAAAAAIHPRHRNTILALSSIPQ